MTNYIRHGSQHPTCLREVFQEIMLTHTNQYMLGRLFVLFLTKFIIPNKICSLLVADIAWLQECEVSASIELSLQHSQAEIKFSFSASDFLSAQRASNNYSYYHYYNLATKASYFLKTSNSHKPAFLEVRTQLSGKPSILHEFCQQPDYHCAVLLFSLVSCCFPHRSYLRPLHGTGLSCQHTCLGLCSGSAVWPIAGLAQSTGCRFLFRACWGHGLCLSHATFGFVGWVIACLGVC